MWRRRSSGGRSVICRADLHNFAPEDKIKYHNDMTTERDIQNQIDFAMDKGREEERVKIVEALRRQGVPEAIIEKALKDIKE